MRISDNGFKYPEPHERVSDGVEAIQGNMGLLNSVIALPPTQWGKVLGTNQYLSSFIYDTRLDSDFGAWRTSRSSNNSSWYQEPLNTQYRGSRKDFPELSLILVTRNGSIEIRDLGQPSVPMWAVFPAVGTTYDRRKTWNPPVSAPDFLKIMAKNGRVSVARYVQAAESSSGIFKVDFVDDFLERRTFPERLTQKGVATSRLSIFPMRLSGQSRVAEQPIRDVSDRVIIGPFSDATQPSTFLVTQGTGFLFSYDDGSESLVTANYGGNPEYLCADWVNDEKVVVSARTQNFANDITLIGNPKSSVYGLSSTPGSQTDYGFLRNPIIKSRRTDTERAPGPIFWWKNVAESIIASGNKIFYRGPNCIGSIELDPRDQALSRSLFQTGGYFLSHWLNRDINFAVSAPGRLAADRTNTDKMPDRDFSTSAGGFVATSIRVQVSHSASQLILTLPSGGIQIDADGAVVQISGLLVGWTYRLLISGFNSTGPGTALKCTIGYDSGIPDPSAPSFLVTSALSSGFLLFTAEDTTAKVIIMPQPGSNAPQILTIDVLGCEELIPDMSGNGHDMDYLSIAVPTVGSTRAFVGLTPTNNITNEGFFFEATDNRYGFLSWVRGHPDDSFFFYGPSNPLVCSLETRDGQTRIGDFAMNPAPIPSPNEFNIQPAMYAKSRNRSNAYRFFNGPHPFVPGTGTEDPNEANGQTFYIGPKPTDSNWVQNPFPATGLIHFRWSRTSIPDNDVRKSFNEELQILTSPSAYAIEVSPDSNYQMIRTPSGILFVQHRSSPEGYAGGQASENFYSYHPGVRARLVQINDQSAMPGQFDIVNTHYLNENMYTVVYNNGQVYVESSVPSYWKLRGEKPSSTSGAPRLVQFSGTTFGGWVFSDEPQTGFSNLLGVYVGDILYKYDSTLSTTESFTIDPAPGGNFIIRANPALDNTSAVFLLVS